MSAPIQPLTPEDLKLAALLLGHHRTHSASKACNDFYLYAQGYIQDPAEWLRIKREIRAWAGDPDMPEPEEGDDLVDDWLLAAWLADKLRKSA